MTKLQLTVNDKNGWFINLIKHNQHVASLKYCDSMLISTKMQLPLNAQFLL